MAVAFFLIVIIIYDLDLAALYPGPRWRARVAGMALYCSLSPPSPPVPSHTPLRYPFPLPPTAAWQQSSLFLPHFTPARRHAQPLVAARARSRSWDGGKERGGGIDGLAGVLGELSATDH